MADTTNIKTYNKKKKKQLTQSFKRRKKEEKTEELAVPASWVQISDSSDSREYEEGDLAVIIDSSENITRLSEGPFATSTPVNETPRKDRRSLSNNPISEAVQILDQVKGDQEGRHGKYTGLYMLKQGRPLRDLSKHESVQDTDSDDLLL